YRITVLTLALGLAAVAPSAADTPKPLKLLFLGDNGHHKPAERFKQLEPVLAKRGIELTYTDKVEALNPKLLAGYDGLVIYTNTKHTDKDRVVLEYREENGKREPWTWVRTQGKGRVFYTAWGHDERTWGNPGFQDLIERGIRWACGAGPAPGPSLLAPSSG